MEKACQAVGCMYASCPVAFHQLSFRVRVDDRKLVQLVRQSVANPKLSHQLAFCHLAVGVVDGLAEMVRVVPLQRCSVQERRDRAPVDGHRQGRLFHGACGNAEGVLDAGVREAEAWRMGWQRAPGS